MDDPTLNSPSSLNRYIDARITPNHLKLPLQGENPSFLSIVAGLISSFFVASRGYNPGTVFQSKSVDIALVFFCWSEEQEMPLSQLHYAVTMERTPTRSESPVCVQLVSGIANVLSGHAVYSWAANNLPESLSRFWSYLLRPKTEEKGSCVEPPTAREFCFQDRKDDEDDNDDDGGARVCREDVEVVMGKLGLFCSHESGDDEELISWDRSMSCGGISRVFEEEEASTEEVREAFCVFDVNRDGFIDAKELQRVLCVLGFDQAAGGMKGEEECERMIRLFDENGDGRIDFQEFVKLVEKGFC